MKLFRLYLSESEVLGKYNIYGTLLIFYANVGIIKTKFKEDDVYYNVLDLKSCLFHAKVQAFFDKKLKK